MIDFWSSWAPFWLPLGHPRRSKNRLMAASDLGLCWLWSINRPQDLPRPPQDRPRPPQERPGRPKMANKNPKTARNDQKRVDKATQDDKHNIKQHNATQQEHNTTTATTTTRHKQQQQHTNNKNNTRTTATHTQTTTTTTPRPPMRQRGRCHPVSPLSPPAQSDLT